MSEYTGRSIEVGLSMGTESAPARWLKRAEADIISRVEKVNDDSTFGRLEDSENSRVVRKWFDGNVGGILHPSEIGYVLLNLYGSVLTSPEGELTQHDFSLEQSISHEPVNVFRKDGDVEQKRYSGGMFNTLEISAVQNEYVRYNGNVVLAQEALNSDTPSYDDVADFIGKDIVVKVADTEEGLSSAEAMEAKELNISYDVGVISDFVLGSYNPNGIYNSKMSIEIEIVKNHDSAVFENLFKSDTAKYMQVTISNGTESLTFLFNKVKVQSWERSGGADELAEETIGFKAFYNSIDEAQSSVSLVCDVESFEAGS